MDFVSDCERFDAVLMNFVVIGEKVLKLSDDYKQTFNEIDWRRIAAFRNILAHDYFGIDEELVWQIIQDDIPSLKKFILSL